MINLRNLPFYFVGIVCLIMGWAFKDSSSIAWYIFGAIFIVMALVFRKPVDTADNGGH